MTLSASLQLLLLLWLVNEEIQHEELGHEEWLFMTKVLVKG